MPELNAAGSAVAKAALIELIFGCRVILKAQRDANGRVMSFDCVAAQRRIGAQNFEDQLREQAVDEGEN